MTQYFPNKGDYSSEVFKLVKEAIVQKGIKTVIVATTWGETATIAAKELQDVNVIAVTHQAGFRKPFEMEISREKVEELEQHGLTVLTTTHALAGVDRAIRKKHKTWQISELIAETLRIFGQGTKVCAEIVLMAADSGLLTGEDVIAIGGTGRGADTAWIITPAHTSTFFDLRMKELICKPSTF